MAKTSSSPTQSSEIKKVLTMDTVPQSSKEVVWTFSSMNYDNIEKEYDEIWKDYLEGKHYQRIIDEHLEFSRKFPSLFRFATSTMCQLPENDSMIRSFFTQARKAQDDKKTNMDDEATSLSYGLHERFVNKKT